MNLQPHEAAYGERPPVTKPHPDFFKFVGESEFRKLVDAHYELIRNSDIANLFPVKDEDEFIQAKKNAGDFFIQISGGPNHFETNRGAPRMIGRHAPFRITPEARMTWLMLYKPLLEDLAQKVPEPLIQSFWDYIDIFSIWMINTPTDKKA